MTVSVVFINWHSSGNLARAVASARNAGSPTEIVVVDNSCDAREAAAIEKLDIDQLIISERNGGYGAGANRGACAARGEWLVIANPDVIFSHGSIPRLIEQLVAGAAVAGPRFIWDDDGAWLLPPADFPTLSGVLASAAATWSRRLSHVMDRRRTRRRIDFWELQDVSRVKALSGAVLAFSSDYFSKLGGFDERFHLYFEETDLIRRVLREGGEVAHVPASRVRHLYNQSARLRPDREQLYLASEDSYLRKWYRFAPSLPLGGVRPVAQDAPIATRFAHDDAAWLEASPDGTFVSAAGARAGVVATVPEEVLRSLHGGSLWVRAVNSSGRELQRWRVAKGGSE